MTEVTAQTTFTLDIVATCDATSFKDWILKDQEHTVYVKGDVVTGSVGPVQDEVSLINGNKDGLAACGARQYRIID